MRSIYRISSGSVRSGPALSVARRVSSGPRVCVLGGVGCTVCALHTLHPQIWLLNYYQYHTKIRGLGFKLYSLGTDMDGDGRRLPRWRARLRSRPVLQPGIIRCEASFTSPRSHATVWATLKPPPLSSNLRPCPPLTRHPRPAPSASPCPPSSACPWPSPYRPPCSTASPRASPRGRPPSRTAPSRPA